LLPFVYGNGPAHIRLKQSGRVFKERTWDDYASVAAPA
jgi:hypothetical protein